ncbi:MAG: hypothetical protein WD834_00850 [Actinomycetota bacterium]
MRRVAWILVAILVVGLVVPQIAGAHVSSVQPRVKIAKNPRGATEPGERVVISGDIRSKLVCRRARVVTLITTTPGFEPIAEDLSNREGEFRFVLRPDNDMTVFAKIRRLVERSNGHRHVCRGATSDDLRINVSG